VSTFEIACEHCGSRYLIPLELRDRVLGATLNCAWCLREWTPLPVERRAGQPSPHFPGAPTLPLHPYLQAGAYGGAPPPAAPAESPVVRSTTQFVRVGNVAALSSLRVAAAGPDLDYKKVFELGDASFLIGRRGCHLDLPYAHDLPERAIRIRRAETGFQFEGIGGYLVPIGTIAVPSGRIEPGARLDLVFGPYRVAMKGSTTPGEPLADLEAGARAAPAPAPPPVAPRPAPPPVPAPPSGDMSQTVRDFSAFGAAARRYSDPLESLDVGLLHLDPPYAGETVWLKKSPTIVGRTAGDIVLKDSRVSGKHAQIEVLGIDQYSIKDLASTNGTTVNERPTSTTRLKDGDVVGFGGVKLQFVARAKKRKD
jgi:hypothetical protein